jgi:hypothetical protein
LLASAKPICGHSKAHNIALSIWQRPKYKHEKGAANGSPLIFAKGTRHDLRRLDAGQNPITCPVRYLAKSLAR